MNAEIKRCKCGQWCTETAPCYQKPEAPTPPEDRLYKVFKEDRRIELLKIVVCFLAFLAGYIAGSTC